MNIDNTSLIHTEEIGTNNYSYYKINFDKNWNRTEERISRVYDNTNTFQEFYTYENKDSCIYISYDRLQEIYNQWTVDEKKIYHLDFLAT